MYPRRCNRYVPPLYVSACAVTETSSDSTTTATVVLDEPALDEHYKITADIYWGTLQKNMTLTSGGTKPMEGAPDAPFGFGYAVQLDAGAEECLKDSKFKMASDPCLQNPKNCPEGMSMSIWHKIAFKDITADPESQPEEKEYILSTGGDEDGHPGIAMYRRGYILGTLLSTGEEFWKIEVYGPLANDSWNNIGLRWNLTHGLQVYSNLREVGLKKHPKNAGAAQPGLSPVEVMVGCHKTQANPEYRDFGGGLFDEVAGWKRRLSDDEVSFFLGGYTDDFSDVSAEDLAKMINQVDMTDPSQMAAAVNIMIQKTNVIEEEKAADPTSSPTAESSTQAQSTASSPSAAAPTAQPATDEKAAKSLAALLDIMATLSRPRDVSSNISVEEAKVKAEGLTYASNLLASKKIPSWRALSRKNDTQIPEIPPSTKFLSGLEAVTDTWAANTFLPNGSDPITVIKETPNIVMRYDVMTVKDLEEFEPKGVHPEYTHFPKFYTDPRLQASKDRYSPIESVAVPNMLIRDQRCEDRQLAVKFMYYPNLPSVYDLTVSEAVLRQDREYVIDSVMMSLTIQVAPQLDDRGVVDPSAPPCHIDRAVVEQTPFRYNMGHNSQTKSKAAMRRLKFHEDEEVPEFQRRYCVWWNKNISDFGGWDTTGCKVLNTTAAYTKCACTHPGVYAILAQKVQHPSVPDEMTWLKVVKYIGYGISALALVIYIALVAVSGDLKEQFHLMGLNLCVAVLAGSIFMVLSDFESIRNDRHTCTMWGSLLQVFYLAAGAWVGMLGHAAFKAITAGIIGGRLRGYWMMSWGIPLISMGLTYLLHLHDLGTDPRCFISWENNVRWYFFAPMMFFTVLAFFYGMIVLCNMSTPALRKDNLIEDYGSFCRGAALVMIYFLLTWGFGLPAYIRFQEKGLDFYPIFQVLNAFSGLIIFLFIGIASKRFRMILAGKAKARREMLMSHAFGLPSKSKLEEPDPKTPADQGSPSRTPSTISTNVSPSQSNLPSPSQSTSNLRSRPSSGVKVAGRPNSRTSVN